MIVSGPRPFQVPGFGGSPFLPACPAYPFLIPVSAVGRDAPWLFAPGVRYEGQPVRVRTLIPQPRRLQARRPGLDLFLLGALILYLAQVSLRWFPEQVASLGRFPNVVLLACLLGTALGCLAAGHTLRLITWTPLCLALAVIGSTDAVVAWVNGRELPSDLIFPGPFFILIALTLAGPGQELGRALDRAPNRLLGFTLILLGGAGGILLFAACTLGEYGPRCWFLVVALGLAYFASLRRTGGTLLVPGVRLANVMILAGILGLTGWANSLLLGLGLPFDGAFWSPYARINHLLLSNRITIDRTTDWSIWPAKFGDAAPPYRLPYLLNRDSGGKPFRRVLVIGAGPGNEVSQALRWGAEHVDAVEIDPVVLRLGREVHPDRPYQDPRVHAHLDDGRRFLRSCTAEYDLILYGLTDIPLPPAHSDDLRRLSYLLTRQAFVDVRRCLRPQGILVLQSRIQDTWFAVRLRQSLEEVFPEPPLVLTLASQADLGPGPTDTLAFFIAGNVTPLRQAFRQNPTFYLWKKYILDLENPSGFSPIMGYDLPSINDYVGPPRAEIAAEYLDTPDDDWPFLFLRRRMLPDWVSRDLIVLAFLSVVLLWLFRPASPFPSLDAGQPASPAGSGLPFRPEMFFLGTGFMLTAITTRADAALLFGDTWTVDPTAGLIVLGLLVLGLALVLALRPARLWPLFAGLLLALLLHRLFPLDAFLGHHQTRAAVGSYLLGLAPVLFAGMIFVLLFRRSPEPARDLGAVLAGAVLGSMAGNLALVWGFRALLLLAAGSFAVAAVPSARRALREYERRLPFNPTPARNRRPRSRLSHFGRR